MLEYEQEPEYESKSKLMFWSPPRRYKVPEAPNGHVYISLQQGWFTAKYSPISFTSHPVLTNRTTEDHFNKIIESANFAIKTPYFKYSFIRWFLCFLILKSIFGIFLALTGGTLFDLIYNAIIFLYCPVLMRYGGGQYLLRMKRFEKVINKALDFQGNARLSGTGLKVEVGKMCLWLDFGPGEYSPPRPVEYVQPVYYYPGAEVPAGGGFNRN